MIHRFQNVFVAVLLLVTLLSPSASFATVEPQASFKIEDGWIAMSLRKEGRPVADAEVRVIDERGGPFANGQTGAEGESTFPMPSGKSFLVEIKVGDRHSDPIRIFKSRDTVEPGRVLLSFGLKPCCRNVFAKESANGTDSAVPIQVDDEGTNWNFLAAELTLLAFAVGFCAVSLRRGVTRT